MLKHFLTALAFAALALPSTAQDASEIAKVRSGQSCPGCNLFQADLAYLDIANINVSGARLRQSDMQLSTFDNWNLRGTNLSVTNMFGVRFNEIFLFGHPRPVRSVQRGEGWTPETIAEHAIPAMRPSFAELERSGDVFSWDPV